MINTKPMTYSTLQAFLLKRGTPITIQHGKGLLEQRYQLPRVEARMRAPKVGKKGHFKEGVTSGLLIKDG